MVRILIPNRRLAVTLQTMMAGLAALSLIAWSARYWLGRRTSLESVLSLSAGQGLARWFASLAWMAVAAVAVAVGRSGQTIRPVPRHQWVTVVLLCVALSIEESTQLLDRMIGPVHSQWPAFSYAPWMLVAAALVVLVSLRPLLMGVHGAVARLLLAAGALYVAGRLSSAALLSGYSEWWVSQPGLFMLAEAVGRLLVMTAPVLALYALGDELRRQQTTVTVVPVGGANESGADQP